MALMKNKNYDYPPQGDIHLETGITLFEDNNLGDLEVAVNDWIDASEDAYNGYINDISVFKGHGNKYVAKVHYTYIGR